MSAYIVHKAQLKIWTLFILVRVFSIFYTNPRTVGIQLMS